MPKSPACRSRLLAAFFVASIAVGLSSCEKNSADPPAGSKNTGAPLAAPTASDNVAAPVRPPANLKPGAKTVALEKAGDRPHDKTFDDLRFEMTVGDPFKREMLPDNVEALKDQRIRIRGFILPTAQKRGLKVFVLVRDNQECCFGPGAALYDCILVEMQPGNTAEYSYLPVTVEGTFDIQEVRGPDGMHLAIYHLTAESVE
jgi:hypothetical protein